MLRGHIALADGASEHVKTISQMSALYDVSFRTLRFYEDRGLLNPTRIGMQRLYKRKDETRLQIILKGKKFGFSLLEIEKIILSNIDKNATEDGHTPEQATAEALPRAVIREKLEMLVQKRDSIEAAIAELKLHSEQRVQSAA